MCFKKEGLFIFLLIFGITGSSVSQELPPVADHHMHIRSEASSRALVQLQKELTGQDIPLLDATHANQFIGMLDEGGVEKAVLLSLAYFFGSPDIDFENEYEMVQQENNYTSMEASKYPDRLFTFCSVNPLSDYAEAEIRRCRNLPQVVGLKLHLANSDVDLRNEDHVDELRSVFRQAADLEMPILIHLFTRNPEYGRVDASIFVEQILAGVPNLYVQIAHMGGAGAYNETTKEVIEYFTAAKKLNPEILDRDVVFDLSATVQNPEVALARGDTARAAEIEKFNAAVAAKMEQIVSDRLLFGTDWIAVSREPAAYADLFRSLPVHPDTLEAIFQNKAKYLNEGSGSE